MRRLAIALVALVASACTGGGSPVCTDVQCNAPSCCGGACTVDADCCRETVCSVSGRCIPESCVGCGELGCLVDFAACEATCVSPDRCGEECAGDGDCGEGARCEAFPSGALLCVPATFDEQCGRCGAEGCTFSPASCEVSCTEPPDAGSPDGGVPAAPSCTACCEPCETDADCCEGAYCGESAMGGLFCFPVECRTCAYGCTFTCPL